MLKVFCMVVGILFVNPVSIPCLNSYYGHGSELGQLKYLKNVPPYFFVGKKTKPKQPKQQPFCFEKLANLSQKLDSVRFLFSCNTVSRTRQHVCSEAHFSAN